tara:strand:- start:583 stop:1602 length:1020 start_codon:yes stop_codon:yes gene_type:complete
MTSSQPFSKPPQHIAGIDLGTNTLRLLITKTGSNGRLTAVYSDQTITRLGERVQHSGTLQYFAMERTIQALQHWRQILLQHNINHPIIVATSAVRDAKNRDEFLQRVQTDVGFTVKILSGHEEARLTLIGITTGLTPPLTRILAIDIGGGSTEFITTNNGQPDKLYSTDLGVVRLTEKFFISDPVRDDEISEAKHFILDRLQAVKDKIGNIEDRRLIGTAGTITTLAVMDQQLKNYDARKVHQYCIHLEAIQRIRKSCVNKTIAARRIMTGIEAGRADVIVAGILILQLIMENLGFANVFVSEFGLREGILLDEIQKITGKNGSLELFERLHQREKQSR